MYRYYTIIMILWYDDTIKVWKQICRSFQNDTSYYDSSTHCPVATDSDSELGACHWQRPGAQAAASVTGSARRDETATDGPWQAVNGWLWVEYSPSTMLINQWLGLGLIIVLQCHWRALNWIIKWCKLCHRQHNHVVISDQVQLPSITTSLHSTQVYPSMKEQLENWMMQLSILQ